MMPASGGHLVDKSSCCVGAAYNSTGISDNSCGHNALSFETREDKEWIENIKYRGPPLAAAAATGRECKEYTM